MHCTEICIISQASQKYPNSYLSHFFNKARASILFLGFQYFELRNINKKISIILFSSKFVIDSGAGLVLCFSPSI